MKIAIVTCCTSNWLPLALATHHSVSRNLNLAVDHFAITNEKDLPEARALLAKFTDHYGLPIRHEHLTDGIFEGCHVGICTTSSLYRLKLPQILPDDYDRVLYLDSDLLALKPLDELLLADMDGKSLAAVDDIWVNMSTHKLATDIRNAIGFTTENVYFNSGVMLFDWKKAVSEKVMEQALAILRHHDLYIADQCAMNMVLRGGWKAMPLEYNWINRVDDCLRTDPVIRHFSESGKPWSDKFRRKDTAHRKSYSDFFVSLGLAPLPPSSMATYLRHASMTYHDLRKRFKRWRKNRPDEVRQLREYVRQKVRRLPDGR
jgi:lipopolysaccharide biosynthesis glycosyltransferase